MHHADSKASPSAAIDSDWAGKERSVRRGKLREYNQQMPRRRHPRPSIARFGFHPRTAIAKAPPTRVLGYHLRQQAHQGERILRRRAPAKISSHGRGAVCVALCLSLASSNTHSSYKKLETSCLPRNVSDQLSGFSAQPGCCDCWPSGYFSRLVG